MCRNCGENFLVEGLNLFFVFKDGFFLPFDVVLRIKDVNGESENCLEHFCPKTDHRARYNYAAMHLWEKKSCYLTNPWFITVHLNEKALILTPNFVMKIILRLRNRKMKKVLNEHKKKKLDSKNNSFMFENSLF